MTTSQKVHLRRCASSFVITTYDKYVSFLKIAPLKWLEDSTRALHLELFTVSSVCGLFTSPSRLGPLETNFIPKMKLQAKPNKIRLVNAALEKIDHCVAAVESCEGELTKDGYSQLRAQLGHLMDTLYRVGEKLSEST
ncbi:MAG: hypothetical protein JRD47_10585 [Deltaproteobacteria bacterium]|nr:hypothetical protein [Deltaproteobacteria bacterium]